MKVKKQRSTYIQVLKIYNINEDSDSKKVFLDILTRNNHKVYQKTLVFRKEKLFVLLEILTNFLTQKDKENIQNTY